MKPTIITVFLIASIAANMAAMVLSTITAVRALEKQDVLAAELAEARKAQSLAELRAKQALDELHALKMGKPE